MMNEDNQEIVEIEPENESAGRDLRPRWRIYGLLAFAVLAGVFEHYIHFGFARLAGFGVPLVGAIVAGAVLGFVLRLRSLSIHVLVFVIMLLVARTATLYMDYTKFRENRIRKFAEMSAVMNNIALQKLSQEGHDIKGVAIEGRNPVELYKSEMKQRAGRADFLGYLRLLFRRGLRDAKGAQVASAWGVAVFLIASTLAFGAACFIISKQTPGV